MEIGKNFIYAMSSYHLFTDCYGVEIDGLRSRRQMMIAFELMFKRILYNIIRDKVEFKLPGKYGWIISFDLIDEEMLKKKRRVGRLQKVDVVQSNFVSYHLVCLKYGKPVRKRWISLHGEIEDFMLEHINNGEVFYPKGSTTLDDYLPELYKMYPNISHYDIYRLMSIGFERMSEALTYNCSINIYTARLKVFMGFYPSDPREWWKKFVIQQKMKARLVYKWNSTADDGYFYIPVKDIDIEDFKQLNYGKAYNVKFINPFAYKVLEETFYMSKKVYIFRVKLESTDGKYLSYIRGKIFHNPELYGIAEKGKFRSYTGYWKRILENEERIQLYI